MTFIDSETIELKPSVVADHCMIFSRLSGRRLFQKV